MEWKKKSKTSADRIVRPEKTRLLLEELGRNTLLKPGEESTVRATEDWDSYPQDYYVRPGQVQGYRGQEDQSRMLRAYKGETQLLPVPWGNMFEKLTEVGLSLREGTARRGNPFKGTRQDYRDRLTPGLI